MKIILIILLILFIIFGLNNEHELNEIEKSED